MLFFGNTLVIGYINIKERLYEKVLKGIQKTVIMIRPEATSSFEQAYFVLKNDNALKSYDKKDMIREANRIISDSRAVGAKRKKRRYYSPFMMFIVGAVSGALSTGILCLSIYLSSLTV